MMDNWNKFFGLLVIVMILIAFSGRESPEDKQFRECYERVGANFPFINKDGSDVDPLKRATAIAARCKKY